jgi:streptogramin lyase
MNKLFVLAVSIVLLCSLSFAQNGAKWEFSGTPVVGWDIATDQGEAGVNIYGFKNPYSVAIDPNGNIWCGSYFQRYRFAEDGVTRIYPDDIEAPSGDSTILVASYPIFIMKTDASYDSLVYLSLPDESVDTLLTGHRGMVTDHEGNIIVCHNSGTIYKMNYLTYEVMDTYPIGGAPARPACDASGYVFHIDLFGGTCTILDPADWSAPYNTIENVSTSVSRGMEVSPDGMHAFFLTSANGLLHYYSADGVDGTYALEDTLLKGYGLQGFVQWDPAGLVWAGQREEDAPYKAWALDPAQDFAVVDSSTFTYFAATDKSDTTSGGYAQPQYLRAPRDAAFNASGDKFYFADFYSYTIKEFSKVSAIPGELNKDIPGTFTLYNNYPNPFNPTTIIPFDLHKPANVKLVVFDALGRKVGTYLDQPMTAGSHQFEFDGSNLSSGTYYYKITVDTKVATGRMLLVK